MQPVVRADASHFDRQTRAYAEFRLFSRLAAERGAVASSVVTLGRADTAHAHYTVCWIALVMTDGETLHVTATEPHAYAAIDRAVADIARALRSRAELRRHDAHEIA